MSESVEIDFADCESVEVDLADYEHIYNIFDDQGYVGRASILNSKGEYRGADERFTEHVKAAQKGEIRNCARLLSAAIAEKGEDAFEMRILETVHTKEAAVREIFWINELNTVSPNGYNLMGGSGDRYNLHPDTKELMRKSHMSFGNDAQKRFNIKVERKVLPKCVGYRGFFNGKPKGFFSNTLTEEQKRSKAIHYNLTGEHEYERRIPRARKLLGFDGETITQPGVKPQTADTGNETYRAYHPSRSGLKEKSFGRDDIEGAIAYAKELIALSDDLSLVPEKYKAIRREKPDPKNKYLKQKSAKKDKPHAKKGEVYAYDVEVPAKHTKSGEKETTGSWLENLTPEENRIRARKLRNELMKDPIPL